MDVVGKCLEFQDSKQESKNFCSEDEVFQHNNAARENVDGVQEKKTNHSNSYYEGDKERSVGACALSQLVSETRAGRSHRVKKETRRVVFIAV